ncbi:MAG TPA: hypothetical protein P5052_00160 [Candidatus Paceibacterota bacterium]|nr:hypothetical protein [Candidatus Paceibacterota bacterium]HRZ29231.1 hypothetical protein [Candidatus Paceibacterota bacterium]
MIDPNNANNLNPQNVNNNTSEPIDPSFLPKDSNVYIRTMNTDLTDLKSRGGEALPYVETPSPINNMPSINVGQEIAKPIDPINPPPIINPAPSTDFSNITQVNQPVSPNIGGMVDQSLNNEFNIPQTTNDHSTLEGIQSKINELNSGINNPNKNNTTDNLSANLNDSLNKLIAPEEFSPLSNADLNSTPPKSKNKLLVLVLLIILIVSLIAVWFFIIRPKMLSPKVSFKPTTNTSLLAPATTVTTLKPTPFITIKDGYQANNLDIDVSKSPEIVTQIRSEANNLLPVGEVKIIMPKIKNQFLTSSEIVNAFVDNIPPSLLNNLDEKYLVYSFYGEVHPALGIVLTVDNNGLDQIKADFLT